MVTGTVLIELYCRTAQLKLEEYEKLHFKIVSYAGIFCFIDLYVDSCQYCTIASF